jgi:5-methylcytosine-specific restriction endonuclease McrA
MIRQCVPVNTQILVIKRDNLTCQYCGKQGEFIYRFGKPCVIENPQNIDLSERTYYNGRDVIPFEIDHIEPIYYGGNNEIDNLVLACRKCNRSKGAR